MHEDYPQDFVSSEDGENYEDFKRCPICKSAYTEESLVFCLTDGAPLDLVVKTLPDALPETVQSPNDKNEEW